MGLSGSSSTTTNKPIYGQQLTDAAGRVTSAYDHNLPNIDAGSQSLFNLMPSLQGQYLNGNPATNSAENWVTQTLGSDSGHNPFLDQQIANTNNDVANTTNAKLGTRGLTGGTVMQDILSRNLANNETGLRYQDYTTQQQLKAQAAGMAPALSAARTVSISPLLQTYQAAAGVPLDAANGQAQTIGGLLGQYQTTTQKTSNPGGFLGSLLSAGATLGASFSDRRLKRGIEKLGEMHDGLGVYRWEYNDVLPELPKGEHVGVMADEVASLRPWALGPKIGDYATVDYSRLMEAH